MVLRSRGPIPLRADNVQEAGEAAITPLLSLNDSFGLSYGFDAPLAGLLAIPSIADHAREMICGIPFGPSGREFDPGLMGTGFISAQRARSFVQLLSAIDLVDFALPGSDAYANCIYPPEDIASLARGLAVFRKGFIAASSRGLGLMVTDFRE